VTRNEVAVLSTIRILLGGLKGTKDNKSVIVMELDVGCFVGENDKEYDNIN
jgi:hypothetical protein